MRLLLFITIGLTFLYSCKKDQYGPQAENPTENTTPTVNTGGNTRLFICNEGNFTWGNASLSVYYPHNKTIENQVFSSVNNQPLGDVAQSITFNGNTGYIIVNNSNKIEVIDKNTYQQIQTIQGFNSPRYMTIFGSKAYVSDLYQNAVYTVDLTSHQISGQIPVNGWCEHLLRWGDTLLIENIPQSEIYFLNTSTDQIFDTLSFSSEMPSGMVIDTNGKLWILFSGGTTNNIPSLYRVNLLTRSIERNIMMFPNSNPKCLISPNGKNLYFLHNGVKKISITDTIIPSSTVIPENNRLFYALQIDSISGDIYVSDAKDYVQQGQILRYNTQYQLIDSFTTGIIPGYMVFDY